jgi:hypothetical protein
MRGRAMLILPGVAILVGSCTHSSARPVATPPPPAPTPTAAAPAGAPPGAGGRASITPEERAARRDSIARLRASAVREVMASIAGRENEPAGQVFRNVQFMKDVPAGRFIVAMDSTFGRALSVNCSSCHVVTDWAADTRPNKGRTLIMLEMVRAINTQHLSKMPAGRGGNTPTIGCMTCHRGNANPGNAIMP